MIRPILTSPIASEGDVVSARQRAKRIAAELGFEAQDQTRVATAVSEIVRNAYRYAGGGKVQFLAGGGTDGAPRLVVRVSDDGPGIGDLEAVLDGRYQSTTGAGMGLRGARRLMDGVAVQTSPAGTSVTLEKRLPRGVPAPDGPALTRIARRLAQEHPAQPGAVTLMQAQNRELLDALDALNIRQEELERLNGELEDTNRGVVALYAELDQRAEELRRANELKTRFLANMSHEFRTPLNSVRALAGLLLDRVDGPLTAEQEKQVTLIRRAAESLTELVDDLLDIAKVESGRIDLLPSRFTVAELFGGLRGMLRPLQAGSPVELVFEEADRLPPLHTDEGKLTQILRNLIANALKFTESGEVRVSAEVEPEANRATFTVRDTGIGIPPEKHQLIFEEFAQVENRLQAKAKGTGLGLSLSRRLAELLGGGITVDSAAGQGSTFRVTVAIDPAKPRVTRGAAAADGTRQRRLLVIDDEESDRYVIRHAAQRAGVEIVEAVHGEEGVRLAREHHPDLILLDLRMPVLDGFGALDTLAADPETRTIPVVVVTSSVLDPADRDRLAPAADILPKGEITRGRMQELLDRMLGGGRHDGG